MFLTIKKCRESKVIYFIITKIIIFMFICSYISGGVFSLIECENKDITLREILERTIAKRREMAKIVGESVPPVCW